MGNRWQSILDLGWLCMVLPWALLASAVVVVAWALFRSRPGLWGVPRLRCPKCWYDMAGAVGDEDNGGVFACPECGKRITNEHNLRKTRRRWGVALLVVPLLVGWHLVDLRNHIHRQGWIAAVPTVALMAVVDPQDWLDAGTDRQGRYPWKSTRPSVPAPTLAEHLHYRLLSNEWLMSLWLWRAGAFLDREGYTVIDVRSLAPIERVTADNVWAYRNGPNWWSPGDLYFGDAEKLRDSLTWLIDESAWRSNGGEFNIAAHAGNRLLIKAPPNTIHAAKRLIRLIEDTASDPDVVREERIHGHNFVAFSIHLFADTDWYAKERARWDEIGSTHTWVFIGGGMITRLDDETPSVGVPVVVQAYADSRFEWETSDSILEALRLECMPERWVAYGGEAFSYMWINGVIVVRCEEGWGKALFQPAFDRIHELGPDAIIAGYESPLD